MTSTNPVHDAAVHEERKAHEMAEYEKELENFKHGFTNACMTFDASHLDAKFAPSDSVYRPFGGGPPQLSAIIYDMIAVNEIRHDVFDVLLYAAQGNFNEAQGVARKVIATMAAEYASIESGR